MKAAPGHIDDPCCMCNDCFDEAPSVVAAPVEQYPCECEKGTHRSFTFDEDEHEYALDGHGIPGVSRVLELIGLRKEFTGAAELGAQKGKNVHKWLELYDRNGHEGFHEGYGAAVDEACVTPYIAQWRTAKAYLGIGLFDRIEERGFRYISGLHVAGTCDRVYQDGSHAVLLDIKTGKPSPSKPYRMQTALYSLIFKCARRVLVYLPGDAQKFEPERCIEWHDVAEDVEIAHQQCGYVRWRKTG